MRSRSGVPAQLDFSLKPPADPARPVLWWGGLRPRPAIALHCAIDPKADSFAHPRPPLDCADGPALRDMPRIEAVRFNASKHRQVLKSLFA